MPIGAFPLRHLPVTRARGASVRSVFALLCATTGLVGADGWPDAAAQPSAGAPAAAPPSAPAAAPAAAKPAAPRPAATKPATPAAKSGAKTPATKPAPGPAEPKLLPPPKAVTLSKADVFQRASAATVMLIAKQDLKWQTALGTIIKPQGVVVSDTRLLGGVEKGQIFAFTYDPSMSADEDPMLYLNAHKEQALPVQVVRADTGTHLLMLQLPALPPKKTYPYLELYDMRGITVGVDVISINTRGRQTLALGSGSVVAMRPELIEVEPGLGEQNAGGPVLTLGGRLIGVATYADKSVNASGVARPTDVLRDLLAGKIGVAPGAPAGEGGAPAMVDKPQAEVPSDARNAVEAVRIGLGALLAQKYDKHGALQLHSEFITAMAARGKHLVREVETGEQLNAMAGSLAKLNESQGKVVAELFPMLVADKKGAIWRKVGTKYEAVRPTAFGLGAVDDATGALYAVDPKKQLIYYDAPGKSWRNTGISPVQQVRASQGSLYVLLTDGHVLKADASGHDSMQVFPRSVKSGTIEASQGILYVVEGGEVYRYRDGKWDNKLGAIAHAMTKLVARGTEWYGMDITGKVFSSTAQRYIDRDANVELMWPVGKDLLVLTRKNERLLFRLGSGEWQNWSQW